MSTVSCSLKLNIYSLSGNNKLKGWQGKIEGNYDKINVVRGLVLFILKPYTNSQKQNCFLKSFQSHKWQLKEVEEKEKYVEANEISKINIGGKSC